MPGDGVKARKIHAAGIYARINCGVAPGREIHLPAQSVYGYGALLAHGDCVYCELGAGYAVTASKHVFFSGLIAEGIDNNGVLFSKSDFAVGFDIAHIYLLTYGRDDGGNGNRFKFTCRHRLAAALFVGFTQLHELKL